MGYHLRSEAAAGPREEGRATRGACTPRAGVGSGYRYYSPGLGRWVNRDPIGELGGINLYVPMLNSLQNAFDLLGLRVGRRTRLYLEHALKRVDRDHIIIREIDVCVCIAGKWMWINRSRTSRIERVDSVFWRRRTEVYIPWHNDAPQWLIDRLRDAASVPTGGGLQPPWVGPLPDDPELDLDRWKSVLDVLLDTAPDHIDDEFTYSERSARNPDYAGARSTYEFIACGPVIAGHERITEFVAREMVTDTGWIVDFAEGFPP